MIYYFILCKIMFYVYLEAFQIILLHFDKYTAVFFINISDCIFNFYNNIMTF